MDSVWECEQNERAGRSFYIQSSSSWGREMRRESAGGDCTAARMIVIVGEYAEDSARLACWSNGLNGPSILRRLGAVTICSGRCDGDHTYCQDKAVCYMCLVCRSDEQIHGGTKSCTSPLTLYMPFKTRSPLRASAAAASCVCGGLQVTVLRRLKRMQVGSRFSRMANRFQKEVQIPL